VKKCPKSGQAIYQLAMARLEKGEVDQAISALTPILDDEEVDARFPGVLLYAQLVLHKGDIEHSLQIANQLNEQMPNIREVVYLLARANLLKGDYEKSRLYSYEVISKWPIPKAYSTLIVSDYELDNYEGVISTYSKTLENSVPTEVLFEEPTVALAVSHSYFLLGNNKDAVKVMRNELSRNPGLSRDKWVAQFVVNLKKTGYWD